MRRLLLSSILTAGFLLLMSSAAFAAEVSITDDGPDPRRVEVDVREEIMWTNNTDSEVSLVGEEPNWESGVIAPGATFSIEITQEGTYAYRAADESFTGQIVVGQAGGDGNGGNGEGEGSGDDEEDENDGAGNNNDGGNNGGGGEDDEEALPMTGIDAGLPGALSVLLVLLGVGMLVITEPTRRFTS